MHCLKQDEDGQYYMEQHNNGIVTRANVSPPKDIKLVNPGIDLMRAYLTSDGIRIALNA